MPFSIRLISAVVVLALTTLIPPVSRGQSAFSVKGATSDSLLIVKDDGKVGIGTAAPREQLDVKGAIKIGTGTSGSDGTVRFSDGRFEGSVSNTWYALSHDVFTLPPQTSMSSTVRNSDVDFSSTLFTIPDTGWYLIIINAEAENGNSYQFSSGVYDEGGYIYLRNAADPINGGKYFLHRFAAKTADQNDPSLTFRYPPRTVNHSMVRKFDAGTQIVVGAVVQSVGTPTTSWNVYSVNGTIIRIK